MKFETLDFIPAISYAISFVLGYLFFFLPLIGPIFSMIPADVRDYGIIYLITLFYAKSRCKKLTFKDASKKSFSLLIPFMILTILGVVSGFIPIATVLLVVGMITNPFVIAGLGLFIYKPLFNSAFKKDVC